MEDMKTSILARLVRLERLQAEAHSDGNGHGGNDSQHEAGPLARQVKHLEAAVDELRAKCDLLAADSR
jgi:hypothetical protein